MATMAPHASPTRILAAARPSAVRRTRTGGCGRFRPARARERDARRARARRVRQPRARTRRGGSPRGAGPRDARVRRGREAARRRLSGGVDSSSQRTSSIAPSGTETGTETETVTGAFPGTGRARASRMRRRDRREPGAPAAQLDVARDVAAAIGVELWEVPTDEGDVPEYVANEGESCLHCKNTPYSTSARWPTPLLRAIGDARPRGRPRRRLRRGAVQRNKRRRPPTRSTLPPRRDIASKVRFARSPRRASARWPARLASRTGIWQRRRVCEVDSPRACPRRRDAGDVVGRSRRSRHPESRP